MRPTADKSPTVAILPKAGPLARFDIVLITAGIWSALALLFALRAGQIYDLACPQIALACLSTIAGPFAFFGVEFGPDPGYMFVWGAPSVALTLCHPIWRSWWAAILSVVGVSLWFLSGFGLTYIGV